MQIHEYTAGLNDDGRRLDRILRKALPSLPLSGIHRLLRTGQVWVEGTRASANFRVAQGNSIRIVDPLDPAAPNARTPAPKNQGKAPALPGVLLEQGGLLFLNKPPGLPSHGPHSLDTQVQGYLQNRIPESLSFKPGPLHRLDTPASGVIAFSASLKGAQGFSALLAEQRLTKRYLALVEGSLPEQTLWDDGLLRDPNEQKTYPLANPDEWGNQAAAETASGAREKRRFNPLGRAISRVYPLATGGYGGRAYSLIMIEIVTGRTHQIRAQAALHGFPLGGDKKYGGNPLPFLPSGGGGLLLHAHSLKFPQERPLMEALLPGIEPGRVVKAPLPDRFQAALAILGIRYAIPS